MCRVRLRNDRKRQRYGRSGKREPAGSGPLVRGDGTLAGPLPDYRLAAIGGSAYTSSRVTSGVNFTQNQQFEFPYDVVSALQPIRSRMPPCSGQSRPSPSGGREDAASLDRPCARRLRELAVGMEECSRRGSNQRMRPKRARKPTISNRWFSGNFSLALTLGYLERGGLLVRHL